MKKRSKQKKASPKIQFHHSEDDDQILDHLTDSSEIQFHHSEDDNQILAHLMETLPEISPKPDESEKRDRFVPKPKKLKPRKALRNPEATLDLHGKTQEEAIMMVQNFITTSHQQGLREVLIITGRGLHSGKKGPVLNRVVAYWLKKNGKTFIRNVAPAPPQHGGSGALWVQLS